MTIGFQRIPRPTLRNDAFYASMTGVPLRKGKKTHRTDRGTYTMRNAVYEPTYMKQAAPPRDQEVCDPTDRPKCSRFDERTLDTWQDLWRVGSTFADDRAANDYLFYKHDCRRSLGGVLHTPASAWEVFAVSEMGLTPLEFLATGASVDQLVASLESYKLLDDYSRTTLYFLLKAALDEVVDRVLLEGLCRRLEQDRKAALHEDTSDDLTPTTTHATERQLGGYVWLGGGFVWCGK